MDLIMNIVYFSVQILLFIGCALVIWSCYITVSLIENGKISIPILMPMRIIAEVCVILPTVIAFALIIYSLLRLKKLSAGTLVISKKLFFFHVCAFGVFTLSNVVVVLAINKRKIFP